MISLSYLLYIGFIYRIIVFDVQYNVNGNPNPNPNPNPAGYLHPMSTGTTAVPTWIRGKTGKLTLTLTLALTLTIILNLTQTP